VTTANPASNPSHCSEPYEQARHLSANHGKMPAEVMPGVELLKVHSTSGVKMYILRAEGVHY